MATVEVGKDVRSRQMYVHSHVGRMEAMSHVKSARAALFIFVLIARLHSQSQPSSGRRPLFTQPDVGIDIDINRLPCAYAWSSGTPLVFLEVQQISSTMWGGMTGSAQQAGHYGPAGGGGKFCARLASRNFLMGSTKPVCWLNEMQFYYRLSHVSPSPTSFVWFFLLV